jgi:hypothetical protein
VLERPFRSRVFVHTESVPAWFRYVNGSDILWLIIHKSPSKELANGCQVGQ